MTYKEKLLDPRWQKKRLEILNRDEWACQLCGDTKTTLHIHHICYDVSGDPWKSSNDSLITFCKHCHAVKEHIQAGNKYIYKIIKLETLEGYVSIGVFFLCHENVFDLFLYTEKTGELTFLTCLPSDYIESIHNHFVTTNILLHG